MRSINIKYYIISLVFIIPLISVACKNETIALEENIKPGKRDYNWSIDSVDYGDLPGQINLYSIWGSSANDVWGAGFTEDVRNCLWHYDGKKWQRAVWGTPITQFGNGSKSVGGVWGTAENDVWAFGGRLYSNPDRTAPFIMHFDGTSWVEITGDINQMPTGFRDIYPIRKNHFWISSSDHVSEYKDGVWKKYFIADNSITQSIEGVGNDIFLTNYIIGIDTLYLMKLVGNKFEIIDRTNLSGAGKFEHNGLLFSENVLYTFGSGITSTTNLAKWNRDLSGEIGFRNGYKLNEKSIWGLGYPSNLYHYNGIDWIKIMLPNTENSAFTGAWGNTDEIFIGDTQNGKVYHGK